MNITLEIKDKPVVLDDSLSEDEMEVTEFQFAIEELSQYVTGSIFLIFDHGNEIALDLFYDFLVCYDDIVDSIRLAKNKTQCKDDIWFCEQGSDFYFLYEINENSFFLEYKKGSDVGFPNKAKEEFKVEMQVDEYCLKWRIVFDELSLDFKEKLGKDVALPF
ncbi:hypothetical protein [Pectobacterium versatile]|uniref:hypothetical protein n=1 Tax=Pectobacterium versatile TaxID=2488639 RepID=UPI00102E4E95|nr:hypothetical protein [Pectobacterium versatile]TAI93784.1 hypothetical protein EG332_20515 [Pectobacterium versatile]UEQ10660.1 hypothetical protein LLE50_06090 [Pectobacterium versatile]